ncbi:DENN domain-containing protein 1A-like isoform X2 [Leptidea sinapis]|uniref:DENN domain-containing protein 1A-like isoform X2 n=1 Tax=Leptidea sinapis TaxID=189913 RepID=UPI00213828CC|nr:DENN domain-containing protein 1A-like isoform X2 [Leptidea sinapis]
MGSRVRETARYLFELFCEVSPGDQAKDAYIVKKYPESYRNEEELKNIPKFTFPCELERSFIQHYSFVLTSVDSKYTFCFCRYDPKANTSFVFLSHLPWHDIFYKLLNCIANLVNSPESRELVSFLEACRIRPPMPGHTLKITYNAGLSVFSCQSPDNKLPSIPENCNLTEYFSAIDTKCMAGLWAALLHERRVAIVASKPSRLSACVQAANATLFPMTWQHIFIPILPKHLIDYLAAPMPYLIGVPRTVKEMTQGSELADVVILDVDANKLDTPFNDLETLPPELVASLKKALSDKNALGDTVSRAFLRALVCLIGGYRDAIRIEKGQLITFNPEAFVKTRKNMQPFLNKILQSQIFQQFIDERLELLNSGRGFNDEFEVECNNYADKLNTGSGQRLKQQYRDWAKNVKKEGGAFFKNVKNKVRQGGRNVRSAVRDLKNKIPKTGSRPSSSNTTDENRFSCSSATPLSSDSSSSSTPIHGSPPLEPPPSLPLDLLPEMEFLFTSKRHDMFPNNTRNEPSSENLKTMTQQNPPRLPKRPATPVRYPIIFTRKLVDLSDAPTPPPRSTQAPSTPHFISNIVKNDTPAAEFHTSTIRFSEGGDKAKLKLTLSNKKTQSTSNSNGNVVRLPAVIVPRPAAPDRPYAVNGKVQESVSSDEDLIKLDDASTYEDFDPLKCRDTKKTNEKLSATTDSALLHEYGLDFSSFCMKSSNTMQGTSTSVPKGWTTFN